MVSAHARPTFELSDAVPLLAKTVARERKLGGVRKSPTVWKSPPLPYWKT